MAGLVVVGAVSAISALMNIKYMWWDKRNKKEVSLTECYYNDTEIENLMI